MLNDFLRHCRSSIICPLKFSANQPRIRMILRNYLFDYSSEFRAGRGHTDWFSPFPFQHSVSFLCRSSLIIARELRAAPSKALHHNILGLPLMDLTRQHHIQDDNLCLLEFLPSFVSYHLKTRTLEVTIVQTL
jgi:hypothetical protein